MVWAMRMQQQAGADTTSRAAVVPTYDLSCPTSPYGSVHNPAKAPIGARIAAQLHKLLRPKADIAAAVYPAAARAEVVATRTSPHGDFSVRVWFEGGAAPFETRGVLQECSVPATRGRMSTADGESGRELVLHV